MRNKLGDKEVKAVFFYFAVFFAALIIFFATSCKKDNTPTPVTKKPNKNTCAVDNSKIKDVLWIANDASFADLKFYSNGVQYQKGMADGTWSISNGCDSVKVTRTNVYYYKIISVTNDSLKLQNPFFQLVIYHK